MIEKAMQEGAVLMPVDDEAQSELSHGTVGGGKTSVLENLVQSVLAEGGEVHSYGVAAARMFKHFYRVDHYADPSILMWSMWQLHHIRAQYAPGQLIPRLVLVTGPVPERILDDMQTFAETAASTYMAVVHAADDTKER